MTASIRPLRSTTNLGQYALGLKYAEETLSDDPNARCALWRRVCSSSNLSTISA